MKKLIVLFAVLAMVFAFTAQAMADMSAYGSIRFRTYTVDTDKEYAGTATTPFDTRQTTWNMGLLSRVGFKFASGDVGGLWELDTGYNSALGSGSTDSNRWRDLRVRHAYGTWNFGAGELLIGQTWPLADLPITGVNYTGDLMQCVGEMGYQTARPMQLRLTFGNLKLAFITPYTSTAQIYNPAGVTAAANDVTIPKIEVGYTLKLENIALDFVGGYQTYEERVVATDKTEDIEAYLLGVRAKMNFGGLYVGLTAGYTQNATQYGLEYTDNIGASALWFGNAMHDAETYNAGIAIGYKISDMVYVEGGYLMADSENDSNGATKYEDTSFGYYAQCKLTMAPGVFIIPEIIVVDRDDTTWGRTSALDEGKTTIAGIFWMINFK